MTDSATHINTLHVQAPAEGEAPVQLRLSAQLSGADVRPPGLAPAEVLLVKHLPDPAPGHVNLGTPEPMVDRSWERAVRNALADCLHRAVQPVHGRIPSGAEAVLFRDVAEAWACWSLERAARKATFSAPWWVQSLETSLNVSSPTTGGSPSVASVWRARPRVVPAMAAHLAAWEVPAQTLQSMFGADAEEVLRSVSSEYGVFVPSAGEAPAIPEAIPHADAPSSPSGAGKPDRSSEGKAEPTSIGQTGRRRVPPWAEVIEKRCSPSFRRVVSSVPLAIRELMGIALALQERPVVVRSGSFREEWQGWRHRIGRAAHEEHSPEKRPDRRRPRSGEYASSERLEKAASPGGEGRILDEGTSSRGAFEKDTLSTADRLKMEARREGLTLEGDSGRKERADRRSESYAATDLGGVLYLVNVLTALDLPDVATTPPVGEHVGAWAILEALARALLGPEGEVLRPSDPVWRVLAALDGRDSGRPAGAALDEGEDSPRTFRVPEGWMNDLPLASSLEGRWAVVGSRLRVWTALGCVVDVEKGEHPARQAETTWTSLPNTGRLQHAALPDDMPLAYAPEACAPSLAWWAARVGPYLRYRLANALDVGPRDPGWLASLLTLSGSLYTTDTHVDLLLPLEAARIDVRAAGLDRSPGWWPPGGRVVQFHFQDSGA